MKNIALAVALMIAGCQPSFAGSALFCDAWSDMATRVLEQRQRGITKEDVQAVAEETGQWDARRQYAVKHAYAVPKATAPDAFKVKLMKKCREDDL